MPRPAASRHVNDRRRFTILQPDSEAVRDVALERVQPPNLLMLQEAGRDQNMEDAQAVAWGSEALSGLRALQRAVLGDGDWQAALARLDRLGGETLVSADPILADAVRAIQLRVAVEVAKARRLSAQRTAR